MDASDRARWLRVAGVVGAAASMLGLVVLGLWLSDPGRRLERAVREEEVISSFRTPGRSVDPAEVWVARSEAVLEDLKRDREALRREVTSLRAELTDLREWPRPPSPPPARQPADRITPSRGTAPAAGSAPELPPARPLPLPPPPERQAGPDRVVETAARRAAERRVAPPDAGPPRDDILMVELGAGAADGGEAAASPKRLREYLPAGSFAGAVLLSGLDAPTDGLGRSNPQPVLLRLEDHGTLPNGFRSRVRECFVTAAGFGDLSSERAYLRLERLSCVTHEGTVLDRPVKGFVAGEDGKAGLRGFLDAHARLTAPAASPPSSSSSATGSPSSKSPRRPPRARTRAPTNAPHSPVSLRLVRQLAPSGAVRVLMTNLLDTQRFPAELFAELYHRRWRIEEAFKRLKHRLNL